MSLFTPSSREQRLALRVGLFTFVALVLFGLVIFFIGRETRLFERKVVYRTYFENVEGGHGAILPGCASDTSGQPGRSASYERTDFTSRPRLPPLPPVPFEESTSREVRMPTGAPRAQLGCRTCATEYEIPHDDSFSLRMLAFFDEHGPGHQPWIDLSAVGLHIPDQRTPERETAG